MRKIIHIDMDAFFASVEQLDNPELRGKPVAVGASGERHVVAAASYEARKYGVRSAMPSVTAKKLCPGLIFVRHRFERYNEISGKVMEIFKEFTDIVEPLSIDEAFLDVTDNKKNIGSATIIARQITRSRTLPVYIRDFESLHRCVTEIRKSLDLTGEKIRLLGVSISNLESESDDDKQLSLFDKGKG
jgi:nucleotidyltransferase/DNA polymerase involved in DNA repair